MDRRERKPSNTNNGGAVGVGVGVLVGIDVGSGVEVAVGTRVSIERGVDSGWGGVLTHAARPIDQRISQDHFVIFTAHTCWVN